jgi:hypothetical protein
MNTFCGGAAEQSSADGSRSFGAPRHRGESAGLRPQPRSTDSPGNDAHRIDPGRSNEELEVETHTQISPGIEDECRS